MKMVNFRIGFTLVDTLIGLLIICLTATLYFETSQKMNQRLDESNYKLMQVRRNYENK